MAPNRLRILAATLGLGFGLAAAPAVAGPAQSYQYERKAARGQCRPPLKFLAGTCVRHCPAGYRDNGSYCRLRNQRF